MFINIALILSIISNILNLSYMYKERKKAKVNIEKERKQKWKN